MKIMTTTNNYDPIMRRAEQRDKHLRWGIGLLSVALLVALFFVTKHAEAGTSELTWLPPTSCIDKSPLTECPVVAYNLEVATNAAGPWSPLATTAPTVTSYLVNNVPPGVWFYRAFTVAGLGTDQTTYKKSPPTPVVSKTVGVTEPGEPRAFSVK